MWRPHEAEVDTGQALIKGWSVIGLYFPTVMLTLTVIDGGSYSARELKTSGGGGQKLAWE